MTGVSRPRGIGAAVCRALVRDGWDVVASGWPQFDREAPWSDPATDQVETLIDDLARTGRFRWLPVDLEIPTAPVALLDAVEGAGGSVWNDTPGEHGWGA